jgi:hypothetical protein
MGRPKSLHWLAPLYGKVAKLEDRLSYDLVFEWTTVYTILGIVNRKYFLWNGARKYEGHKRIAFVLFGFIANGTYKPTGRNK